MLEVSYLLDFLRSVDRKLDGSVRRGRTCVSRVEPTSIVHGNKS
jgi:hypothetical protein